MTALRHDWTLPEIEAIYTAPLPDLIFRAQTVHRAHHRADEVQGCMLLSIKTGGCPEDCAYCPQSARYDTGVTRQELLSVDETLAAARQRAGAGRHALLHGRGVARRSQGRRASTGCWRWCEACARWGWRPAARSACSPQDQADALADAGLTRLQSQPGYVAGVLRPDHHHAHLPGAAGLRWRACAAPASPCAAAASSAWAKIARRAMGCCGELSTLDPHPESVPVNLLVRVEGTPLGESAAPEDPLELVRMIATARILMPDSPWCG